MTNSEAEERMGTSVRQRVLIEGARVKGTRQNKDRRTLGVRHIATQPVMVED